MAVVTLAERGDLSDAARRFLGTESGSAVLLVGAAVVALVWANLGAGYESFWHTGLAVSFGDAALDLDLRHWVNDGLMVLFFLSVGLEIARETTLGSCAGSEPWPHRPRLHWVASSYPRCSSSRSTPVVRQRAPGASRSPPTPR